VKDNAGVEVPAGPETDAAGRRTPAVEPSVGGASTSSGQPTGQVYAGGQKDARGTAAIPTGAWTHLATTYDGSVLRLYVNGAQVRSLAAGGSISVSTGQLKLGGNAIWSEWFAGLMDDVRIYSRALTAAEIAGDMTAPVVLPS
jgi:hypothetical protein